MAGQHSAVRTTALVTQSGQQLEVRALAVTLDELICSWLIDLRGQSLSAKTV
jgi:hypothetical protein